MFDLLVAIGFQEIEVGFPCANQTEFDFVRRLAERGIPDNVWIQVLSPCRIDCIQRTLDSVRGAPRVLIFTYLPSSDIYRETILQLTEDDWVERARQGTTFIRAHTKDDPTTSSTHWRFGFGFEDFGSARLTAVSRCAEAVRAAWDPTTSDWMYIGVASSVEVSMPHVFADRVEQLIAMLPGRETFRLAVHPHNDRGEAVACAELSCLAGAERVEGCLFGNGERAGNVDLVTVAMNCLSLGIDPGLDFSSLDKIRDQYETLTKIPVHPRAPYSGTFYFAALSGGHQDAIMKGLRARSAASSATNASVCWPVWRVPYLPIDPADLGRSMQSVIGITNQSGKAGVAWAIRVGLELDIPEALARSFSYHVKHRSRALSIESTCECFLDYYEVLSAIQIAAVREPGADLPGADVLQLSHPIVNATGVWTEHAHGTKPRGPDEGVVSSTESISLVAAYVRISHTMGDDYWGVGVGIDVRHAQRCAMVSASLVQPKQRPVKDAVTSAGHEWLVPAVIA